MIVSRILRAALLMLGASVVTALATAAPPLDVYGRLPETEMVAMSLSGKRIALVATVKDQRRLIVLEDGKVILSQPFGDQKVRSLRWAGDENVLMQVSRTFSLAVEFTGSRSEMTSVIVIPVDKAPVWAVFERDKEVFAGVRGIYGMSGANDRFGYFGGIATRLDRASVQVNDGRPTLFRVDLLTKAKAPIARQPDNAYRDWLLGPDGQIVAMLDTTSSLGDWIIRNANGRALVSGKSPSGSIDLISLGPKPNSLIYWTRKDDTDEGMLIEQPLDGSPGREFLSDEGINDYIIDPRSRQFIGYVSSGDRRIHMLDPQQDKIVTATGKAFPNLTVGLSGWNQAFDRLLVFTTGQGDPGTWWQVDRTKRTADVVSVAYAIDPADVGPIRTFAYSAADGLDMSGVLTLPPGRPAKNLPVILLPHGGPRSQDEPVFDWWAQAMASRGYAVFQPNFRGSTGFGRAFEQAGWGEWGRKMQTDISDGLAALAKEGIVDPKRACIMGGSYGGYAALAGVTLQQNIYRCAVSVAGVGNVAKLVATKWRESGGNSFLNRYYHQQIGTGRDYAAISPVNLAAKADAPVLLIHGVDDIVVPFDQSSDMAAALTRAGKPVEFVKLPGEDHWLSRGETRLAMLKAAVAFIEKHNPPDPAPTR
jgi:dipeptidyl aminopeptidase/acylaminoacyl peptidase